MEKDERKMAERSDIIVREPNTKQRYLLLLINLKT